MKHQNADLNTPATRAKPASERGCRRRFSRRVRLGLLGAGLLVTGALGASALNAWLPKSPDPAQGFGDRLAWYFQRDQFQADLHTLAGMAQHLVSRERGLPNTPSPANPSVAQTPPPTSSKS